MPDPQTYNDSLISEKSRAVFYKAMCKLDGMLDAQEPANAERMHALAATADAAACGFSEEDNEEEYE